MYVTVRDNNVDQALRVLKKKLQREGVFREMKNRRAYEKPSERRAREAAESTRRVRKLMRTTITTGRLALLGGFCCFRVSLLAGFIDHGAIGTTGCLSRPG